MARDATGRRSPRPQSGGSSRQGRNAPARGGQPARSATADATAVLRAAVGDRLGPALAEAGFDLEDLTLSRAGSRSVLRVAVDRDGGVDLDAVANASRLISGLLDQVADEVGLTGAYVLEVTSPGVDRPLTAPRHWRRAQGRLVEVRRADGTTVTGRVLGSDDAGVDLAVPTGPAGKGRPVRTRTERVAFAVISRAVVQVEFGSGGDEDARAAGAGEPSDGLAGVGDDWDDEDGESDLADEDWEDDEDADDGFETVAGAGPGAADDLGWARREPSGHGHQDAGESPGEETYR